MKHIYEEIDTLLNSKLDQLTGEKKTNEDDVKDMLQTIEGLLSESEYNDHFRKMLKLHGVKSPAQIPPEKRGLFFKTVSKTWKAKKKN